MGHGSKRVFLAALCLVALAARTYGNPVLSALDGQGGATSSITGVVQDAAGGVIPGATVVAASNATGTKYRGHHQRHGRVQRAGASTRNLHGDGVALGVQERHHHRRARAARHSDEHQGDAGGGRHSGIGHGHGRERRAREHDTATVASTLNVDQIAQIPTPTRDVLNAVTFIVGVNQTGVARGNATVNGLPESFLNITLDGVSNNDNFNKSTDGFFAPVRPRQDAIEAVTVTTAAGGADVGGHGAVSINFVTRQGTNRYSGSVYEYYRDTVAQHELLVQQAGRAPEERRAPQSVRRPGRRPDRDSRPLRRPRQGVLLRPL